MKSSAAKKFKFNHFLLSVVLKMTLFNLIPILKPLFQEFFTLDSKNYKMTTNSEHLLVFNLHKQIN